MTSSLFAMTMDCADAAKVAGFWSAALDRPVDPGATAELASIGLSDDSAPGPRWIFHQVPEPKAAKNRLHADLMAADLAAEVKRLVGLGAAEQADITEGGYHWVTLADPEGNEFDVVAAG